MTTASSRGIAAEAERPWNEERSGVLERLGSLATSKAVLWLVVGAGILLRLARYADNRSLWLDESYLSLNIIEKSATELLGKLDYLQAAPPGFLLAEKLAVTFLGESEYALRLVPLIAGIASLFLFCAVARRFLALSALLLATVLFAVNEPLIYYSSEVKPYSTDVAVGLGLLLLACRITENTDGRPVPRHSVLALAGVVGVWFSFTAVFVLAAIVVALIVRGIRIRDRSGLLLASALGLVWFVSFAGVFLVSSQNTSRISDAIFGESHGSDQGLRWLELSRLSESVHAAWGLFVDPFSFERGTNGLAALMLVVGVFALVQRRDDLKQLALLTLPLVAAFGAAVLDRYPLGGRFSLYLVPFALILVSRGVQGIATLSRHALILAVTIAAFLAVPPTVDAVSNLLDPPAPEDVRPLLRYLTDNAEEGDVLYVYRNAQYALRYYGECDDCDAWDGRFPWPLRAPVVRPGEAGQAVLESVSPLMLVQHATSADQVLDDLEELDRLPRGKRIWFLFSHVQSPRGLNEEAVYLAYLDKNGRRIDGRRTDGAAIYLYELSRPPPS